MTDNCANFMQNYQTVCNSCQPECLELLKSNCTATTPFGSFHEFTSFATIGFTLFCSNSLGPSLDITAGKVKQSVFSDIENDIFKSSAICTQLGLLDNLQVNDYTRLRIEVTKKVLQHKCNTNTFELPNQPKRSSGGSASLSSFLIFLFLF
jgi:hypothetical protein